MGFKVWTQIKTSIKSLSAGIQAPALISTLVVLACVYKAESCIVENFTDFQTYKTGLLAGQWQTVEQFIFGISSIGGSLWSAHLLRSKKISLAFLVGFIGIGIELIWGLKELNSRIILIPMFLGCGGGVVINTLLHTTIGGALHQQNPFFIWSLISFIYSLNYLITAKISAHWEKETILAAGILLLLVAFILSLWKSKSALTLLQSFPYSPPSPSTNFKETLGEMHLVNQVLPRVFWGYILVGCSPVPTFFMEHLDHLNFPRSFFQSIEGWSILVSGSLVPLWALFTRTWAPRVGFYVFSLCQGIGIFILLSTSDITFISLGMYISTFGAAALSSLCLSEGTTFCHQNSTIHFAVVIAALNIGNSIAGMITQPISQSIFDRWGSTVLGGFWCTMSFLYIGFLLFSSRRILRGSASPKKES